MKKFMTITAVLLGLLLVNPVNVQACSKCTKAQEKQTKCKMYKLKKKVKLLWMHKDYLGITEEQMGKIKDIKHGALKALIQLKADKEIVMVDLNSAMWDEMIDVNKVNALIDKKYAAKTKTAKTYVKALSDIQKVLTKDQRAKFKDIMVKAKFADGKKCPYCEKCEKGTCPYSKQSSKMKGSKKGSY